MNLRIAWRNIWRNKKRTLITISSITLAVVMAVFTRSFQEGTYAKMIENAVGKFTGYVQVHQKDYWDDKTIDNGIEVNDTLVREILSVKNVEGVNLRLESFSLASFGNSTKGTLVMGIDPEKETQMLDLKAKMIKGNYIRPGDRSIILGSKLADYLKIDVGDTLVLLGQGHWGQSAIGAFPVKGILKMPAPDIDRQIVFMPLMLAREFFSFENGVTSLVVISEESDQAQKITDAINASIDTTQYKAITWQEMSPEMLQQIEGDKVGGIFMIAILYMIIAFGVFGTVLMMTEERKREFAVMVAIGMQKTKLMLVSFYETILMNSIGIILGVIITVPLIIYFNIYPIEMSGEAAESIEKLGVEPVLPTILRLSIFINNIIIILVITGISSIYPLISLLRLKVIRSLRR
ncbi:MAG: ABC transporter permease [Chlorobi bacterium]|nr:ABC transporter permease [Chlorobiota bacterium]